MGSFLRVLLAVLREEVEKTKLAKFVLWGRKLSKPEALLVF